MSDHVFKFRLRLIGRKNPLAPVPTSKEHEEPKLLPESEGQDGKRVVAMVRDGINDAPVCPHPNFESFALILMGSGSDVGGPFPNLSSFFVLEPSKHIKARTFRNTLS
jgi:hypothetical protein